MRTIWVDLVTSDIPSAEVNRFVHGDPSFGAVVVFEGITRGESHPQHGSLVRLDYEAYGGMAEQELAHLAATAAQRWNTGRIALIHRIGSVAPAEPSVVIAVACPHRNEAFEASRWLIDTLKKDVPIWKRDVFEDGFEQWSGALPGMTGRIHGAG